MSYNPLNKVGIDGSILIINKGKFFLPVDCRLSNVQGILRQENDHLAAIIVKGNLDNNYLQMLNLRGSSIRAGMLISKCHLRLLFNYKRKNSSYNIPPIKKVNIKYLEGDIM